MKHLFRSTGLLALVSLSGPAFAQTLHGTLYKDPNCTCCEGHAQYMKENGIEVDIRPVDNLSEMSEKAGFAPEYMGCHMIMLDGYVIEGHVTVDIIEKLLKERPADVVGLSLP